MKTKLNIKASDVADDIHSYWSSEGEVAVACSYFDAFADGEQDGNHECRIKRGRGATVTLKVGGRTFEVSVKEVATKARAVKVSVFTDEYEASHQALPRGRGSWLFNCERNTNNYDDGFWIQGTYGEAKRQAVKEAKARGWKQLFVQP